MPLVLGIDIGTSSVKAVVFNTDLASIASSAGFEYPLHRPAPGYAEQEPSDWWNAVAQSVRAAISPVNASAIVAIGLTGHMHAFALLDRGGRAVRPAIIWADQRSAAECASLIDTVGAKNYAAITGTLPAAGFAAPTLLWLNRHEPQTLARTAMLLPPKDTVRFMLTGEAATDPSDAAATGMFDVSLKMWSPEIVNAVGLSRSLMPAIRDSASISGTLRPAIASLLGLPPAIPVITGCADQPAQAIANGLIQPGRVSITVGSGGQVFVPVAPATEEIGFRLPTDPRVHVFNHAVPGTWYVLGATLSAGLSLRWLREVMHLSEDGADAYSLFSAEAAEVPPGANGLIFLPYLAGERTPHFDTAARGAFIGLTASHGRGHLARAVMEGVAYSLREALAIGTGIGGAPQSIIAAGGAMGRPVWRQIMADVLGQPLRQTGFEETSALGAALLAGVGAGIYDTFGEASTRTSRAVSVTEPNMANHARYNLLYAHYVGMYHKLRADMHALAGL